MFQIKEVGGYRVVPMSSVALNGRYLPQLNIESEDYDGPCAMLLPSGSAAMDDTGERPYGYADPVECLADIAVHRTLMQIDN